MTLKQKTFSAVRWTTLAGVMRAFMQITQVAILSRLLSPKDYGLMAMVGVVLSFASLFSDMGINSAYIYRQGVTLEQRSSLFWLNILVSVIVTLIVIASSPLFAWYFGNEQLTSLMILSSMTFIFSAIGQQVRLTSEKELDFRPVVLQEIVAALLGFASAVVAALSGWGVYSLVVSGIVSALANTALSWIFLARGWFPMRHFRKEDVRPFLGFGSASLANNIVNQINSSIDIFLGGRLLNSAQLGLYSVPRNLTLQVQFMVNPIITRVGFPLIAMVQSEKDKVKAIYLKTINMTSSTNAPIYLVIAFFAPEIVSILLGSGWVLSSQILRILALWGGIRSTANTIGSLLYGMGRADLSLKWNLGLFLVTPAVMWVASKGGPEGISWALLCLQLILFIPSWYVLVSPVCQAGLAEYTLSALKPFLLAALSVLPGYLLSQQFDGQIMRLAIGISVSAPIYLILSYKYNLFWFV